LIDKRSVRDIPGAIIIKRAEIRGAQLGEVFIVVGQDVRKCLICDNLRRNIQSKGRL
jgi:hypothetical protein